MSDQFAGHLQCTSYVDPDVGGKIYEISAHMRRIESLLARLYQLVAREWTAYAKKEDKIAALEESDMSMEEIGRRQREIDRNFRWITSRSNVKHVAAVTKIAINNAAPYLTCRDIAYYNKLLVGAPKGPLQS